MIFGVLLSEKGHSTNDRLFQKPAANRTMNAPINQANNSTANPNNQDAMKSLSLLQRASIFLLMLLATSVVHAQYYNLSTDIYDQDIARNVEVDPTDGGHVTTGYCSLPTAAVGIQANLVKYDATGAAVWARTYDFGTGLARGNDVEKTADGGYIIAGHAINPLTGIPSAFLIKTDPLGGVMWSQFYGFGASLSEAYAVEEVLFPLVGSVYAVTGGVKNAATGTMDVFAMLTDPFGAIISESEFDTGAEEEGFSIKKGPAFVTGGVGAAYVISGYSTFGGPGPKNVFVCGLDFALGMIWGEVYGGPREEEGRAIEVSPLGDILVAGWSNSFSNGRKDVFVSQLNSLGAPIWQNIYGLKKDEEGFSTEYISDGTIAVTGWTDQLSTTGRKDAFLFKTNLAGTLLFSRAFGGPVDDIGYSIKESISTAGVGGELLMAGVYGEDPSVIFDDRDIYTVRTNAGGNAPCARNPKFRQLAVAPFLNTFVLPAFSTADNMFVLPVDPFVPFAQKNRCCTCPDMMVSFSYDPTFFCSGVTVLFTNTSDCVDNYRWLVNGVVVSSATDLSYVFPGPGIYTITLQGQNAGCPVVSFSQTITVTCGPTPRIEEEVLLSNIKLSPNPASSQVMLQVEMGEGSSSTALVHVTDMTGRTIYENNFGVDGANFQAQIQTSDWTDGIYMVHVISGGFEQTQRLMIAR